MIITERVSTNNVLLSFLVLCFSVFILGIAVPAQADNASDTRIFIDLEPLDTYHEDADPFKGLFTLNVTNSSTSDWLDFHFQLFDPMGTGTQVVFDPAFAPTSSQSGMTWTMSADKKQLDLFFDGDTVLASGGTATFVIYTDNTANGENFGVMYWPTVDGGTGINGVVPEPVSSALFIVGGATLGFRRYLRRKK